MPTDIQNLLVLATGILAGLTSIPLVYFALHSHRQLGELRRSHRQLHRIVADDRRDTAPGPARRPAPAVRPHRERPVTSRPVRQR